MRSIASCDNGIYLLPHCRIIIIIAFKKTGPNPTNWVVARSHFRKPCRTPEDDAWPVRPPRCEIQLYECTALFMFMRWYILTYISLFVFAVCSACLFLLGGIKPIPTIPRFTRDCNPLSEGGVFRVVRPGSREEWEVTWARTWQEDRS